MCLCIFVYVINSVPNQMLILFKENYGALCGAKEVKNTLKRLLEVVYASIEERVNGCFQLQLHQIIDLEEG